MKLSKIKKVCTNNESIQMIVPTIPGNMIQQWIGSDNKVFFPVQRMQLTAGELGQLWDLTADKVHAFTQTQVEEWIPISLANVPAMGDAENKMELFDFGIYYILYDDKNQKTYFLEAEDIEPCMGSEMPMFIPLPEFQMFSDWMGIYVDGKLCAVAKCADEQVKTSWYKTVDQLAHVEGLLV